MNPSFARSSIPAACHKLSGGFTLIEMAVAVFIIALLLGSILVPLTTQVEQRQISDTQKTLDQIKEALVGFAITKEYLPCPDKTAGIPPFLPNDTPNDGIEDFNAAGDCINTEGNIPWATLGIAHSDAWGNRFRYRVAQNFAQHVTPFTLATQSTLEVCTTVVAVSPPPDLCSGRLTTSGDGPPAVIMTHGRNGYLAFGATTGAVNPCPPPGCSGDEIVNGNGDARFVSRTQTSAESPAGEFDDIVVWLSKDILFHRMVAAGKLPKQ